MVVQGNVVQQRRLRDGDEIMLGKTRLLFEELEGAMGTARARVVVAKPHEAMLSLIPSFHPAPASHRSAGTPSGRGSSVHPGGRLEEVSGTAAGAIQRDEGIPAKGPEAVERHVDGRCALRQDG